MSAGKSATNHIALGEWKANMQPTLCELNDQRDLVLDDLSDEVMMGWLGYLDMCQEFAGPRIATLYPSGLCGVFVRERGQLRMAERETGGITVSPQAYIKAYYSDDS